MSSQSHKRKGIGRPLRLGLALWCIQALVLAVSATLLEYGDGSWVDPLERVRVLSNFMADPLEIIAVEASGILCTLGGLSGPCIERTPCSI
jgi:hypothetical protein